MFEGSRQGALKCPFRHFSPVRPQLSNPFTPQYHSQPANNFDYCSAAKKVRSPSELLPVKAFVAGRDPSEAESPMASRQTAEGATLPQLPLTA